MVREVLAAPILAAVAFAGIALVAIVYAPSI
jgi:hypothetical protein